MNRQFPKHRRLAAYRTAVIIFAIVAALAGGSLLARSQNPTVDKKQGETRPTLIVPGDTTNAGEVVFKPDSDHDGMPDADEAKNGTDPNDPSDADGDADGDGLTNGDEVANGSGVNNSDSDGDGVSDGDEARLGFDPTNPGNTPPPNAALVGIQLRPATLRLSINTMLGSQTANLRVFGVLNTGATVDLTNSPDTVFQSANTSVALVDPSGAVVGVTPGTTTLTAQNKTFTAQSSVVVTNFTPFALSSLAIPGYANNVAAAGNYAYVAAGGAGLQVVDVTDRGAPRVVGSYDTPGNANDVYVNNNLAYVADGAAGLQIINVTNPAAPALIGTLHTPGELLDIVVHGSRAYAAGGNAGLIIIDVSAPAAPALLGRAETALTARGVDVWGDFAVVAEDAQSGGGSINFYDIIDPRAPYLTGSLQISGHVHDVIARDSLAYVALVPNGLWIADFSAPAAPRFVGFFSQPVPNTFAPHDYVLAGRFLLPADENYSNGTPVFDVADPSVPRWRGNIFNAAPAHYAGTGVAADHQYVFKTGEAFGVSADNGTTGDTRLSIGWYQVRSDDGTVPPTVTLDAPTNGQIASAGSILTLAATASDDIQIAGVQFIVNGAEVGAPDAYAPYRLSYPVPAGVNALSITAAATDLAGNRVVSAPVNLSVTPNTPPELNLVSPAAGATLQGGRPSTLTATAVDNGRVRNVAFKLNGVARAADLVAPYTQGYDVPDGVTSLTVEATATDNLGATTTVTRTVAVTPDPRTTVTGRALDDAGQPLAGVTANVFGQYAATTGADGRFNIPGVPTFAGNVQVFAGTYVDGRKMSGASALFAPVGSGTTDVGNITLAAMERIVFTTGRHRQTFSNREIYVMNADGSDQTRLTNNTVSDHSPIFSPDGTKIAFTSERGGNFSRGIYVMNSDGTEPTRLDSGGFDYQWSADSQRLLYSNNGRAYVVSRDGTNRTQISRNTNTNTDFISEVSWSADNSRIAYTGYINNLGPNVFVMNADGSNVVQLTNNTNYKSNPAISRDGRTVAYVERQPSNTGRSLYDIYVADFGGGNVRKLTTEGSDYYDIVWMPDSTKLAAIKDTHLSATSANAGLMTGSSIWLFSLDGTPPRQVSYDPKSFDWGSRLSRDASKFAFAGNDGLFTVNFDGTERRLLTEDDWDPDWGPAPPRINGARTNVAGVVLDSQRQPVAGATVTVQNRYTAATGADGTFNIPNVPAALGPVTAHASALVDGKELAGDSGATAPVGGGVTNVGTIIINGMAFERRLGTVVDFFPVGTDNASTPIDLPFPFKFYSSSYTRVYVGSNGYLTFFAGDTRATESVTDFANNGPRIAPLFDDWLVVGETADSAVFVNTELPGKAVFTWKNMVAKAGGANLSLAERATFQLTLYQDGRIQFGYADANTGGGLVGITPGVGNPFAEDVDFSSRRYELFIDRAAAPYEQFTGATSLRPFDLNDSFITFAPDGEGGYRGSVQRPPATTVRGTVHDANGAPVRGARVHAHGRDAVTNSDGTFELFEVKATAGPIVARVLYTGGDGQLWRAQSAALTPIVNDFTEAGTLTLEADGEMFDQDLGEQITVAPGNPAATELPLPFSFPFYAGGLYGRAASSVYVNAAGFITLAPGCVRLDCADAYNTAATGADENALVKSRVPLIAPFYSRLDAAATGQVFVKSEPGRWVLTFKNVQRTAATPGGHTFQIVLRPDGTIRFAYDGVTNTFAHVGLSPGGFGDPSEKVGSVDWSQFLSRPFTKAMPLLETFKGDFAGQPAVNPFDLDHSVVTFLPTAAGSYDVLRHRLPGYAAHGRILFDRYSEGRSDVYSMSEDGSDQVNVSNRPGDNYSGDFSPDGSKIVFSTDRHATDDFYQSKVYVMNADGTDQRMLSEEVGDDYVPKWSPDGTKIVFNRYFNDEGSEVYVMNADGSNKTRITDRPGADQFPTWSPDSTHIMFESWDDSGPNIIVANVVTGEQRKLNGDLVSANIGSFSPDGSRVAFSARVSDTTAPRVYLVNVDGSGLTDLFGSEPYGLDAPQWSPDGTKLMYRDWRHIFETSTEIYLYDLATGAQTRLTNNPVGEAAVTWSPDGSKILYSIYEDSTHEQIYVMDNNGANLKNISRGRWNDFYSAWKLTP
jgi:Tol biopolymer transport system component